MLLSVPTCFVFPLFLLLSLFEVFAYLNIVSGEQFDFLHPWDSATPLPFHCFWIWWEIFQHCSPFSFSLHHITASQLASREPASSRASCAGVFGLRPGWRCLGGPLVLEPPPGGFPRLGRTDHCCRSTARFWYDEGGNWFLVPLALLGCEL